MNTTLEQRYDDEVPTAPTSEPAPLPGSRAPSASSVRPIRPSVEAFGLTHTGLVRATNEDAYIVRRDLGFFAVADGMGGAAAGEVASLMAIDAVREEIEGSGALCPAHPPPLLLLAGVELANALVHAAAEGDPSKRGMGTTFTGMLVFGDASPSRTWATAAPTCCVARRLVPDGGRFVGRRDGAGRRDDAGGGGNVGAAQPARARRGCPEEHVEVDTRLARRSRATCSCSPPTGCTVSSTTMPSPTCCAPSRT